jgi:hypothetical protein
MPRNQVCEYELERQKKIAANHAQLKLLGIIGASAELKAAAPPRTDGTPRRDKKRSRGDEVTAAWIPGDEDESESESESEDDTDSDSSDRDDEDGGVMTRRKLRKGAPTKRPARKVRSSRKDPPRTRRKATAVTDSDEEGGSNSAYEGETDDGDDSGMALWQCRLCRAYQTCRYPLELGQCSLEAGLTGRTDQEEAEEEEMFVVEKIVDMRFLGDDTE